MLLICSGLYTIINIVNFYFLNTSEFRILSTQSSVLVCTIFLGLLLAPLLIWSLFQIHELEAQEKIDFQVKQAKIALEEKTLILLREQRNDILNALSVVNAYLQLGKHEKARHYLEFIAADQSDKYNFDIMFDDVWQCVIDYKIKQADDMGIKFYVLIEAEPPRAINKKRLLPRLMAKLLDNAFLSAINAETPEVWLRFYSCDHNIILEVSDNGPPGLIEDDEEKFSAAELTNENHCGWELSICRHIAQELGGHLSFCNDDQKTTVTFTLRN